MTAHLIEMFENRLRKMNRHYSKIARKKNVSCYRIYDRDLPEFPYCIERYEQDYVVWKYQTKKKMTDAQNQAETFQASQAICRVLEITGQRLHLKVRKKKTGQKDQYQKLSQKDSRKEVAEGGLVFRVNLDDYLDTGLFLDHRETRQRVRELSRSKRVLNLFCYTGSFSVYAADGGAEKVTSVDLSNSYLRHAEGNMKVNGLYDPEKHFFVKSDVKKFLEAGEPESYDLVILDPPTFSNSKSMEDSFEIQRDHVGLIRSVLRLVNPSGKIIFSTNRRQFELDRNAILTAPFEKWSIRETTKRSIPFDFAGRCWRWCFEIDGNPVKND